MGLIKRDYTFHYVFIVGSFLSFIIFIFLFNTQISDELGKPQPEALVFYKKRHTPAIPQKTPQSPSQQSGLEQGDNQNGLYRQFYTNGRLFTETSYQEGQREGISKVYFKTGRVKEEMEWHAGKPQGFHRQYGSQGRLKYEAFFKDGRRNGAEITYYDDGNIMLEETYQDGQRLSTRRYDPQGNLVFEKTYQPAD